MSKFIKVLMGVCMGLVCMGAFASPYYTPATPNYVNGYTRSNGTTVQPYYRAERGSREFS